MESVPVFPLPGVVLLPDQRMPLHIFEPRYKQLVTRAIEGSREILVTGPGTAKVAFMADLDKRQKDLQKAAAELQARLRAASRGR